MKKSLLILALAACGLTLSARGLKISVTQDKADCRYKVAEKVNFHIVLKDAKGTPVSGKTIYYRITGDGGLKQTGKFVSAETPATVTATIGQPGFIRLEAFRTDVTGSKVDSGAAFEPEKIQPATAYPADFDAFWANEIAELAKRAGNMKVEKTPIETHPDFAATCQSYEITLDDGVLVTRGVLAMPKDAQPGRHAIIMMFNGASMIGCPGPKWVQSQAHHYKAIVFLMNLHDTINFPTAQEKSALRNSPQIFRYQFRDADNAAKYGAGDVFRRVLRTKAYLKTMPEWDGKTVIARGGSLGGAQALVAAYNDPDVKLCVAGAPAMCDHMGWSQNRFSGWPNLFAAKEYRSGVKREAAVKVMPYFDIVNFARKVTCPVIMSVGYIDYICPPGSVWAAYNVIGSQNKVFHQVPMGDHGRNHDPSPKRGPGVFDFGGREVGQAARKAYQQSANK